MESQGFSEVCFSGKRWLQVEESLSQRSSLIRLPHPAGRSATFSKFLFHKIHLQMRITQRSKPIIEYETRHWIECTLWYHLQLVSSKTSQLSWRKGGSNADFPYKPVVSEAEMVCAQTAFSKIFFFWNFGMRKNLFERAQLARSTFIIWASSILFSWSCSGWKLDRGRICMRSCIWTLILHQKMTIRILKRFWYRRIERSRLCPPSRFDT